jgi:hypothetical protein
MKKKVKKLVLNKTTIQKLNLNEQKAKAGGGSVGLRCSVTMCLGTFGCCQQTK